MKRLLLLFYFTLLSLNLFAQVAKNFVDSFILSKTNQAFMKLLVYNDVKSNTISFSEPVDSLTGTFTFFLESQSGQPIYYIINNAVSCSVSLTLTRNGIVNEDLPDFDKIAKLGFLYDAALIDKKMAMANSRKYLVDTEFQYDRSQLVHDFNSGTTYWQIISRNREYNNSKFEITERSIFIDAFTGNYSKTSDFIFEDNSHEVGRLYDNNEFEGMDLNSYYGVPDDTTNFKLVIIPDYFLLGTLSDYMGRFTYVDRDNQIDRYGSSEQSLARYLASYIEENYNAQVDTLTTKPGFIEMYNPRVSKRLNTYYGKNGNLISNRFTTKEQVYSFLLGLYYRHGQKVSGNMYYFSFANSSKDIQVYRMLRQVGCEKILYRNKADMIPAVRDFYFEASPKLIRYFETLDFEKSKKPNKYLEYLKENKPGYEKEYEEYKMKRIEIIQKAFKHSERY